MQKSLFILLGVFLFPLTSFAVSLHFGDFFLKGSEVAKDDVYAVGRGATFVGAVTGDAVFVGGNVLSESDVSGDILFIGEDIRVEGNIQDDARLIGGVVSINGTIKDDAVIIATKVVLGPASRVEGSLFIVGGEVLMQGAVLGDAKVLSGKLTDTGSVEGDLEVWGEATFREPARIGKDFIYHTNKGTPAPLNVTITGKVIRDEAKEGNRLAFPNLFLGGFFSLSTLMMLALGFALFLLARERSEEVLRDALSNFWLRALRGFIILLIMPALSALLVSTIVGIPIAVIFVAFLAALLLLSWGYSGLLLGVWCERLFFKSPAFPLSYRPVLLGIIFISVISLIPLVGPLFHGILMLTSAGSLGTLWYRGLRSA